MDSNNMRPYGSPGDAQAQRPSSQPQQPPQMAGLAKPPQGPPPKHNGVADVKPRLTKEQHDILEAHFRQQHKPSTSTKKGFADTLGVPLDKINVSLSTPSSPVLPCLPPPTQPRALPLCERSAANDA